MNIFRYLFSAKHREEFSKNMIARLYFVEQNVEAIYSNRFIDIEERKVKKNSEAIEPCECIACQCCAA